MFRIRGLWKIAAVGCLAAAVITAHNNQRTVYTPINMMAGTPLASLAADDSAIGQPVEAVLPPAVSPVPTDGIIEATQIPPTDAALALAVGFEGGISHTVQSGENLYRIALQYDLSEDVIAAVNGLSDTTIYAGQSLLIPVSVPPPVLDESPPPAQTSLQANLTDLGIVETPISTYPPPPTTVNGIPVDSIAIMPEGVTRHIRNIFAIGQSLGRDPRAFSKLGDSTIENPHFLTRFDTTPYFLGEFAYLQDVIHYYAGSFGRQGNAVRRGLHTWSVLDPMWAGGPCQPGETMLACELRIQNASVLIIHLGSNDAGVPESTRRSLREIVEYCMVNGVIPILGTKADRHEGSNINNEIIRQIAFDYNLPLWDFDPVAGTLPGRGLAPDGVHMTSFFAHDWRSAEAFQRGYGLMNLTALITLDKVWRAVWSGQ